MRFDWQQKREQWRHCFCCRRPLGVVPRLTSAPSLHPPSASSESEEKKAAKSVTAADRGEADVPSVRVITRCFDGCTPCKQLFSSYCLSQVNRRHLRKQLVCVAESFQEQASLPLSFSWDSRNLPVSSRSCGASVHAGIVFSILISAWPCDHETLPKLLGNPARLRFPAWSRSPSPSQ